MSNIEIFLKDIFENKVRIYMVIDNLIKNHGFHISSDTLINDYRTVYLKNNKKEELKIITTIIFDNIYVNKLEFIDIYYRNNTRNLNFNYESNI